MKHLKNYRNYKIFENKQTDEEIHELCRKYNIKNYTINEDKSIDVDGDVDLFDKGLTKLPLKFRNVSGYFNLSRNKLETLEGSPEIVEGAFFYCNNNRLKTLIGGPKSVSGHFYCSNNKLTTLEGAPEHVGGVFACNHNVLTTLEGVPSKINMNFNCSINYLKTLEGAPEYVDADFNCENNELNTLEGAPRYIGGNLATSYNEKLFSLEGFPDKLTGYLLLVFTPVFYFWNNFLNKDKSLIDSFVEEWDVIHEDTVIIEVLEGWMEDNNINVEIDIEKIKSLGYKIG